MHSFQISAEGASTNRAPTVLPACHRANTAPVGSAAIAIRPSPSTSMGSVSSRPPASTIPATVAATSEVARYVVHTGGASCSGGAPPRPATTCPPTEHSR